ncbi:MAG: hypothetical protein II304_12200 [Bacteroidales bacterium]|nr:hypothetical protein [Bacteroidales bacterium]
MKTFKIFTVGKSNGLTLKQQMEWRLKLSQEIENRNERKCIIHFVHPPYYFDNNYTDLREMLNWEINQISDSNIMVVDLSAISDCTKTLIELSAAQTINNTSNKHIYIVGFGNSNTIHPWFDSFIFHKCENIIETAEYITTYLLI